MKQASSESQRSVGLLGATQVGIGAIVGGGILVLAGVAFQSTGPSTLLAFALNGAIAVLTALSFAEMSASFPISGGAYAFAKKVLSVRAAFVVGWILWFAYIVAGALYAIGFAAYAVAALVRLWPAVFDGAPPAWLGSHGSVLFLAIGAVIGYALALGRRTGGGAASVTWGKVVVFAFLIIAGLWALGGAPEGTVQRGLSPFLAGGFGGLVEAMGFTFIALQGFEVIAAIAGEVRSPERTLPRAMFLSLGAALAIYLPLLFVVSTVGVQPGESIVGMSRTGPDTVMAVAVQNYLGPAGYWLVLVAAIMATLSALHANILASSRVALSMARDRTLPRMLATLHPRRQTPVLAIFASALAMTAILLMVPDVASAGAAASLIFLISFALAHGTAYLARRRLPDRPRPFRTPAFPLVPFVGGAACAGLAIFQGISVPASGAITLIWLGLGVLLYFSLFASRARAVDAFTEANDPDLAQLRGKNPLVLVPVANPQTAPALVGVANAIAAPGSGKVLLLSVVASTPQGTDLRRAQDVLHEALSSSLGAGYTPEALVTIAPTPWAEISRVARTHRCESLLLGMTQVGLLLPGGDLEALLNEVPCDVALLRVPEGWHPDTAQRLLVPIAGHGGHDELRARLLGSLARTKLREVEFMRVLPGDTSEDALEQARRSLLRLAEEETTAEPRAHVVASTDVAEAVVDRATSADLVIMGIRRRRGRRAFGELALKVAREVQCATLLIGRGD